jgi:osmoprotectant transport system permease protein
VRAQLALLPLYLTAHLQLSLCALLVGVGVSVPLGVLVTRVRRLEGPVMALASITQTIPALALLAVMVPLLAALRLESIGFLPAFIGLVLYSMLPILRNTIIGLDSLEASLLEAARGVGMTPAQQLRLVELPLAMPVIVAGIRTSAVWTVGMATLSTPVGAPSLGNYIFSGLQTRNFTAVLFGCVVASALALLLDGLVRALERAIRERRRSVVAGVLLVLAGLYVYTGVSLARGWLADGGDRIAIGAKSFTEQYVLSAILARYIERETGIDAEIVSSLGSTVAFDALQANQIDVYVDYSGTVWATIMKRDTLAVDRQELLRQVAGYLHETGGMELVAALGFENAYALAMRDDDADRLGVRRISELTPFAPRMSMGGDYEFFARPEWARARDVYHLEFRELRSMDPALMYQAAGHGTVDVIGAFSTDGRIKAYNLRVLEDDLRAIPPYDAILLASARVRARHPEIIDALHKLAGTIDADQMRRMNQEVDEEGKDPDSVARAFVARLAERR